MGFFLFILDSQLSQIKARCTGITGPGDSNSNVGAIIAEIY
jgi:hypothetical protein